MTTTTPLPEPTAPRDDQGRFAKSNRGGPGNPFARQVAQLRQVLLNCVTAEDMQALARKLMDLAKDGSVPAIKLLLSYTLGKPAPAVEPDQLDVQEWDLFQQTAGMTAELPALVATPDPSLPLTIVRAARPAVAQDLGREMHQTFEAGAARERKRQQQREQRRQRRRERREQRRCPGAGRNGRQAPAGPQTNGQSAQPAAPLDREARRCLEALAERDQRTLNQVAGTGADCPSVAQAAPSTNGCNRTATVDNVDNAAAPLPGGMSKTERPGELAVAVTKRQRDPAGRGGACHQRTTAAVARLWALVAIRPPWLTGSTGAYPQTKRPR